MGSSPATRQIAAATAAAAAISRSSGGVELYDGRDELSTVGELVSTHLLLLLLLGLRVGVGRGDAVLTLPPVVVAHLLLVAERTRRRRRRRHPRSPRAATASAVHAEHAIVQLDEPNLPAAVVAAAAAAAARTAGGRLIHRQTGEQTGCGGERYGMGQPLSARRPGTAASTLSQT